MNENTHCQASCAMVQVAGKGSSARVLQADLPACGPGSGGSFVQIINSVLLPFVPTSARTPGGAAGTAYAQTTIPAPPAAEAPGTGEAWVSRKINVRDEIPVSPVI